MIFDETIFDKVPNIIPLDKSFYPTGKPDDVEEFLFESIAYNELEKTQVCAMFGMPKMKSKDKFPAVLLVHGGGGTAFYEWIKLWTDRGYAAITIDLSGARPKQEQVGYKYQVDKLPLGGPDGCEAGIDSTTVDSKETDHWVYHAVSNLILATNLLRNTPQVDSEKIGVIGISWGGFLAINLLSVDHRYCFGTISYGCGFLNENSMWSHQRSDDAWQKFCRLYDPAKHCSNIKTPILFANSTNDPCFFVDIWDKTISLIDAKFACRVLKLDMFHSYPPEGEGEEIVSFANYFAFGNGEKLEGMNNPIIIEGQCLRIKIAADIVKVELHFSTDHSKLINQCQYQSIDAKIIGDFAVVEKPQNFSVAFFAAYNKSNMLITSKCLIEIDKK